MRRGARLRAFAARLFDEPTMSRVVDPAIADLQYEPRLRAYVGVLKVLAVCIVKAPMVTARAWSTDDRRALMRAVLAASAVMLVVTLIAEAPFLSDAWRLPLDRRLPLFAFLGPQALPMSIPIGLTLGLIFGIQGRVCSRRVIRAWLGVASIASLLSFIDLAWITPAANQAFRVAVFGRPVAPGLPELPLGELWRMTSPEALFNLHTRFAFTCSPLVLAFVAVAIVDSTRARRWLAGGVAVVAFFSYYWLLFGGRSLVLDGRVPAYAAAWFPNVVFASVCAATSFMRAKSSAGVHA